MHSSHDDEENAPAFEEGGAPAGRLLFAGCNHLLELPEQVLGIPGAGSGFRMVLHAENGKRLVGNAFHGIVIQVHQRDLHVVRHGIRVHGESVVLGRNADFARAEVFHRVVGPAVAELELEGLRPQRVGNDLVPQADAEHGDLSDQGPYLPVDVRQRGGVPGPVGKKDAVRFHGEHFLRRGVGRNYGHAEAVFPQLAQDVVLDAEVEGHEVILHGGQFPVRHQGVHFLRRHGMGADLVHDIAAFHGGGLSGRFHGFLRRQFRGETGAHGSGGTQVLGDLAGVHSLNADDALLFQPRTQGLRGSPVGVDLRQLRHHKTADLRLAGLVIFRVDAVIADQGIGHRDDLAAVGRVRQDFLVAGHGGVEAGFPHFRARGSEV